MAQVTGRMWLLGRVHRLERECAGDLGLNRGKPASVWLAGFLGIWKHPSQTCARTEGPAWADCRRVDDRVNFFRSRGKRLKRLPRGSQCTVQHTTSGTTSDLP
jgi:hypothetical protein